MKDDIKVQPTLYHGIQFRSKLEAKWAVFFDTLAIPFEYEKQLFKFEDGTQYLPDFWLPTQNMWFEVKPEVISKPEMHKITLLAELQGGGHVAFAKGFPQYRTEAEAELCGIDMRFALRNEDRTTIQIYWP